MELWGEGDRSGGRSGLTTGARAETALKRLLSWQGRGMCRGLLIIAGIFTSLDLAVVLIVVGLAAAFVGTRPPAPSSPGLLLACIWGGMVGSLFGPFYRNISLLRGILWLLGRSTEPSRSVPYGRVSRPWRLRASDEYLLQDLMWSTGTRRCGTPHDWRNDLLDWTSLGPVPVPNLLPTVACLFPFLLAYVYLFGRPGIALFSAWILFAVHLDSASGRLRAVAEELALESSADADVRPAQTFAQVLGRCTVWLVALAGC